jgi:hypothetical protein
MKSSGILRRVFSQVTKVSEVFTPIALMMMALSTSETSVSLYETTRHNNPETVIFVQFVRVNVRIIFTDELQSLSDAELTTDIQPNFNDRI